MSQMWLARRPTNTLIRPGRGATAKAASADSDVRPCLFAQRAVEMTGVAEKPYYSLYIHKRVTQFKFLNSNPDVCRSLGSACSLQRLKMLATEADMNARRLKMSGCQSGPKRPRMDPYSIVCMAYYGWYIAVWYSIVRYEFDLKCTVGSFWTPRLPQSPRHLRCFVLSRKNSNRCRRAPRSGASRLGVASLLIILYYIILYYIILYYIILYYIILYYIILYYIILYYIILYYIIAYCSILYYIILSYLIL